MPRLLFCHVPKCAGMTVITVLKTMCGDRNVWIDDIKSDPPNGIEIIAGHFRSFKYDDIFPDVPKITFLRDPVERMISQFYFHKRSKFPTPRAWWVDEVRKGKMDIVEYAKYESNVLSHYVSKEQLPTFGLIGLQERFEESMELFFQKYNQGRRIIADPYNKNLERKGPLYDLSDDVKKKLREAHEEDYEVYDKAVEIWPGVGIQSQ